MYHALLSDMPVSPTLVHYVIDPVPLIISLPVVLIILPKTGQCTCIVAHELIKLGVVHSCLIVSLVVLGLGLSRQTRMG